jgi:hypothetical protein
MSVLHSLGGDFVISFDAGKNKQNGYYYNGKIEGEDEDMEKEKPEEAVSQTMGFDMKFVKGIIVIFTLLFKNSFNNIGMIVGLCAIIIAENYLITFTPDITNNFQEKIANKQSNEFW